MAPAVRRELQVFENSEALSLGAAELFKTLSKESINSRGSFRAALSGGSTPLRLYSMLATEPYRSAIEWKHVELFFGDERCVPPDHRESNFRAINEALLSHVPVKAHRIEGEITPREAATNYEEELRRVFGVDVTTPEFDLVLLGIGQDGHTASLFPGTEALVQKEKLVTEVRAETVAHPRVTLTLPVINAARMVVFLVSGGGKAEILREVIEGDKEYPASMVVPSSGRSFWFLDKAAAKLL